MAPKKAGGKPPAVGKSKTVAEELAEVKERLFKLENEVSRREDVLYAKWNMEHRFCSEALAHMPETVQGAVAARWCAEFIKEFRQRMAEPDQPTPPPPPTLEPPADPEPALDPPEPPADM